VRRWPALKSLGVQISAPGHQLQIWQVHQARALKKLGAQFQNVFSGRSTLACYHPVSGSAGDGEQLQFQIWRTRGVNR